MTEHFQFLRCAMTEHFQFLRCAMTEHFQFLRSAMSENIFSFLPSCSIADTVPPVYVSIVLKVRLFKFVTLLM